MAGGGEGFPPLSGLHLVSAFLAMEPADTVLSYARLCGGGSVTESVQRFIWDHCVKEAIGKSHAPYLRNFLKKLICEIESNHGVVLDEFYELLTDCLTSSNEASSVIGNVRPLKCISFLFPEGYNELDCPTKKLVVTLRCSLNMLEGDTGCSIWPSSLFLSELILSYPQLFSKKSCFELGSGVGIVGICLAHVKAKKVMLSDGDLSTLANMKINLSMNHLRLDDDHDPEPEPLKSQSSVKCMHLPWESATETELLAFNPDIILGADIIYDPSCLPHLVHVLSTLLHREKPSSHSDDRSSPMKHPVAYITSVIRNPETFNRFLGLVETADLAITDLTKTPQPLRLLPYMQSYDRSSIRLFMLSVK